jgi:transcriptional regulator with XRE-family HTH domain
VTPVDRHVGRRIRGKRRALGLTEDQLAQAIGVDAETIGRYERATEHVPSEHLDRLAAFMDVPLSYFFPATPSRRG